MKSLFIAIMMVLVFASVALGGPFLVCDDPDPNDGVIASMISVDGGEYIEIPAPLHYDLVDLSDGAHNIGVKAKNVWGVSMPSFLDFVKGDPSAPKVLTISMD